MAKSKKTTKKTAIKKTSGFTREEKKILEQEILNDLLRLSKSESKPKPVRKTVKAHSDNLEYLIYKDLLKLSEEPKIGRITKQEQEQETGQRILSTEPKKSTKKVPKTKQVTTRKGYVFDASKPLSEIDLEKARKKTIREAKKSIYSKRSSLKKKLNTVQNERERKNIINEIYRTSRWLEKANERLGKRSKKKTFEKNTVRIGHKEVQRNVYLWEASKSLDVLIDSGRFNTFIVNGRRLKSHEVMEIMEEFDDLEELGALHNDYYVEINQNSNTKTVTINLPNLGTNG